MTPSIRQYKHWIVKSLLVVVYFFLFAAHLNGRYYSIANFFVYGKSAVKADRGHVTQLDNAQHRPAHLSLDKRWHGEDMIRAGVCEDGFLIVPVGMAVATRYAYFPEGALQSLSFARCLRGPPFAA
jgi:hypothetical protein